MALLAINLASGGVSDNYGTLLGLSRAWSGTVFTGLNATAQSTPNMTILVQPGEAMILEGSYPGRIYYQVANDTVGGYSVTIGTADTTNPRIDYVVGYIDKSVTPAGTNNTNVYKLVAVKGTPAATPAVPTVAQIQTAIGAANPYDVYAQIAVGASVTQITTPNITDIRNLTAPVRSAIKTVDANGWTVSDFGTYKQYNKRWTGLLNTASLAAGANMSFTTDNLPVGVTTTSGLHVDATYGGGSSTDPSVVGQLTSANGAGLDSAGSTLFKLNIHNIYTGGAVPTGYWTLYISLRPV
jgi:hypothetical protein